MDITDIAGGGKSLNIEALSPKDKDKLLAGINLIGRTGSKSIQVRFSGPPEDEEPTVWMAVAEYSRNGKPIYEAAAAMGPVVAVMRLCEQLIDGGQCAHCKKPTIFVPDSDDRLLNKMGCVYAYDPGAKKFIRGCE